MESLNKSPKIKKVTSIPFNLKEKVMEVPPKAKEYIKTIKAEKDQEMNIMVQDGTYQIEGDIISFTEASLKRTGKLISNQDFEKRRQNMKQIEKVASGMEIG